MRTPPRRAEKYGGESRRKSTVIYMFIYIYTEKEREKRTYIHVYTYRE